MKLISFKVLLDGVIQFLCGKPDCTSEHALQVVVTIDTGLMKQRAVPVIGGIDLMKVFEIVDRSVSLHLVVQYYYVAFNRE